MIDMRASLQNKSSQEPSSWKQDPPSKSYDKVMGIYAEIVSGQDFHGSKLFVNYQVQVPSGWDLRTGNLSDGMAEKDIAAVVKVDRVGTETVSGMGVGVGMGGGSVRGSGGRGFDLSGLGPGSGQNQVQGLGQGKGDDDEALTGADLLLLDGFADGLYARGMLYGTTHTAIARESRRMTGLAQRPKWTAPYVSFAFERGTRLFIEFSFFVITVVAIILA